MAAAAALGCRRLPHTWDYFAAVNVCNCTRNMINRDKPMKQIGRQAPVGLHTCRFNVLQNNTACQACAY